MFGMGMGELLVTFFVLLLLFGAKNLPEMAKGLGKAVREFRKATNEIREGIEVNISRELVEPATKGAEEKTA